MSSLDIWTILLSSIGLCFFVTGTLGLLRFPDVFCRLHALTKADNLGLGFILLGLIPQAINMGVALHLLLIWGLILLSSAAGCNLIAQHACRKSAAHKSSIDKMLGEHHDRTNT
jgi:multicomponent Na+:H+ antiporter subunit G